MVGCVEGICGMRPDLNGLWVCPAVPSDWKEFTMDKTFRGKKLHITVQNPNGKEGGFSKFTLNGKELDSPYVPAEDMLDENEVVLVM
jgi:cellobiose phosphorylase